MTTLYADIGELVTNDPSQGVNLTSTLGAIIDGNAAGTVNVTSATGSGPPQHCWPAAACSASAPTAMR